MTTNLVDRISVLKQLAETLRTDEQFQAACQQAHITNPFFTKEFVQHAINAGCSEMLAEGKLSQWLSAYPTLADSKHPKQIGIIMAGNIPLVGFHDFLCVFVSGYNALIKLSSKDDKLFPALLNVLTKIAPSVSESVKIVERLEDFDAVIATGSNNSNRYFEYYFREYPKILRKNRSSVAVLSGNETAEELTALADDIFLYFGLGCRSVSKLFVPKDYDLTQLFPHFAAYNRLHEHGKYMNNYDYYRSILLLNKTPHLADEKLMIEESDKLNSPISVVYAERYDNLSDLQQRIDSLNDQLQCTVMNEATAQLLEKTTFVPFGKSQQPALSDYADGVDSLQFLLKL